MCQSNVEEENAAPVVDNKDAAAPTVEENAAGDAVEEAVAAALENFEAAESARERSWNLCHGARSTDFGRHMVRVASSRIGAERRAIVASLGNSMLICRRGASPKELTMLANVFADVLAKFSDELPLMHREAKTAYGVELGNGERWHQVADSRDGPVRWAVIDSLVATPPVWVNYNGWLPVSALAHHTAKMLAAEASKAKPETLGGPAS